MEHAPCISQIATLLADPKRSAMMWALMDGTALRWEKEIAAKDLPKAVADAVAAKYPNAKMKKVEELIKVTAGKEKLECYEVTVEVDGKDVEVEFLPDGKPKAKK